MYSIVSMLITLLEYYSDISRKQEELFISSYDIKMKSHKIKPSFVSPEGPTVRTNKTGINSFLKITTENSLLFDAIHDFSTSPTHRILIGFEAKLEKVY